MGVFTVGNLGPMASSVVKELANIGLGRATTALSDMTGRSFNMSVPHVDTVDVELAGLVLGGEDGIVLGIYMPFEGDVEGHLAFLFPWAGAQELIRTLIGSAPESPSDIDELCASAALEVGNIINSSFLNAISDMTDLALHATPPLVSADLGSTIVSTLVAEAEMSDSVALAIETEIFVDGSRDIQGYFLCIPSVGGLQAIFARLGVEEAA